MSPVGDVDVGAEVVLALGSNLGDRLGHLREGLRALEGSVDVEVISSVLETPAQGLSEDEAPEFLNAVVRGRTSLDPGALLERCHDIEEAAGRPRVRPRASRTLDLDILFYGDRVIREPGLVVPHPRWKERGFVLRPLLEVARDWTDPESGRSVREICGERPDLLAEGRVVAGGERLRVPSQGSGGGPWRRDPDVPS